MPLYHKNNTHILFTHIPKTAGSSITSAFRRAGYAVSHIIEPAKTGEPDGKPCNPQHYERALTKQRILNSVQPDYVFAVTREPLQRLMSEYTWRNPRANHHAKHSGYDATFFDAFQQWAMGVFEAYAKNPYVLDNHIRPQTEFILEHSATFDIGSLSALCDQLKKYGVLEFGYENKSGGNTPPNTFKAHSGFVRAFYRVYEKDYEELNYDRPF